MDGAGISGFCVRFGSVGRKPGPSLTAYITRPGRPIARHQYRLSLSPSAQTPSFETALAVSHLCICSEMAVFFVRLSGFHRDSNGVRRRYDNAHGIIVCEAW